MKCFCVQAGTSEVADDTFVKCSICDGNFHLKCVIANYELEDNEDINSKFECLYCATTFLSLRVKTLEILSRPLKINQGEKELEFNNPNKEDLLSLNQGMFTNPLIKIIEPCQIDKNFVSETQSQMSRIKNDNLIFNGTIRLFVLPNRISFDSSDLCNNIDELKETGHLVDKSKESSKSFNLSIHSDFGFFNINNFGSISLWRGNELGKKFKQRSKVKNNIFTTSYFTNSLKLNLTSDDPSLKAWVLVVFQVLIKPHCSLEYIFIKNTVQHFMNRKNDDEVHYLKMNSQISEESQEIQKRFVNPENIFKKVFMDLKDFSNLHFSNFVVSQKRKLTKSSLLDKFFKGCFFLEWFLFHFFDRFCKDNSSFFSEINSLEWKKSYYNKIVENNVDLTNETAFQKISVIIEYLNSIKIDYPKTSSIINSYSKKFKKFPFRCALCNSEEYIDLFSFIKNTTSLSRCCNNFIKHNTIKIDMKLYWVIQKLNKINSFISQNSLNFENVPRKYSASNKMNDYERHYCQTDIETNNNQFKIAKDYFYEIGNFKYSSVDILVLAKNFNKIIQFLKNIFLKRDCINKGYINIVIDFIFYLSQFFSTWKLLTEKEKFQFYTNIQIFMFDKRKISEVYRNIYPGTSQNPNSKKSFAPHKNFSPSKKYNFNFNKKANGNFTQTMKINQQRFTRSNIKKKKKHFNPNFKKTNEYNKNERKIDPPKFMFKEKNNYYFHKEQTFSNKKKMGFSGKNQNFGQTSKFNNKSNFQMNSKMANKNNFQNHSKPFNSHINPKTNRESYFCNKPPTNDYEILSKQNHDFRASWNRNAPKNVDFSGSKSVSHMPYQINNNNHHKVFPYQNHKSQNGSHEKNNNYQYQHMGSKNNFFRNEFGKANSVIDMVNSDDCKNVNFSIESKFKKNSFKNSKESTMNQAKTDSMANCSFSNESKNAFTTKRNSNKNSKLNEDSMRSFTSKLIDGNPKKKKKKKKIKKTPTKVIKKNILEILENKNAKKKNKKKKEKEIKKKKETKKVSDDEKEIKLNKSVSNDSILSDLSSLHSAESILKSKRKGKKQEIFKSNEKVINQNLILEKTPEKPKSQNLFSENKIPEIKNNKIFESFTQKTFKIQTKEKNPFLNDDSLSPVESKKKPKIIKEKSEEEWKIFWKKTFSSKSQIFYLSNQIFKYFHKEYYNTVSIKSFENYFSFLSKQFALSTSINICTIMNLILYFSKKFAEFDIGKKNFEKLINIKNLKRDNLIYFSYFLFVIGFFASPIKFLNKIYSDFSKKNLPSEKIERIEKIKTKLLLMLVSLFSFTNLEDFESFKFFLKLLHSFFAGFNSDDNEKILSFIFDQKKSFFNYFKEKMENLFNFQEDLNFSASNLQFLKCNLKSNKIINLKEYLNRTSFKKPEIIKKIINILKLTNVSLK